MRSLDQQDPFHFNPTPKPPQEPTKPPKEVWTPTSTKGVEVNQRGEVRTVEKKPVALPPIECINCFMGCVGEPNGPREIHEDRWFFGGGSDEGYESEEDAEDARDIMTNTASCATRSDAVSVYIDASGNICSKPVHGLSDYLGEV